MAVKRFRPTTPTLRYKTVASFKEITKTKPEKSLLTPVKKKGGRNNQGRVTIRHRGGGHKRMYRIIDFRRDKRGVPAKVASIEYDPNRSARIALLHYVDGEKRTSLRGTREELAAQLRERLRLSPEAFLYDTTNFFTYLEPPTRGTHHRPGRAPGHIQRPHRG